MKVFALDLWQDLRDKRLWPVALVLLLGLAAVPVLLAKPAEDPGPPPAANAAPPTQDQDKEVAALAQVELTEPSSGGSGSTLGVFDPSDPFRPPTKVLKSDDEPDTGTQAGPGSDSGPAGEPSGSSGPAGGSGSGTTSGGGTTGGGTTGGGDTGGGTTTTTTTYKYVVDVTFSANGRTRRIKGLEKLDMLPSQASPLLIFMGVTAEGGNAVFLVDSTLKAAGEGRCKPSNADCAFAYIGAGSEHVFSEEDGDSYTVRIDEIRRVAVSPKAKSAKGAKASGARARAAMGPSRRFVPPLVADLVVVATDSFDDSNRDTDRR